MEPKTKTAWYDKTWIVVILCIFLFPVGIYAVWKNSHLSSGWKVAITIIILFLVIANYNGNNNTETSKEATAEPATPRQWTEVISLKGNGNKKSQAFYYSGGKAKIKYDFKAGEMGMFALYVVPEGQDVMREGGIPEVMLNGGEQGESSISHLSRGNYYLNVAAANGQWTVTIEEEK